MSDKRSLSIHSASQRHSRFGPRSVFVIIFLVASSLGAYWQLNANEFVNYDDDDYVTANKHVQSGLTIESIIWAFTTGHTANWHPVTWLSHMLDCQLFGLNPQGHHFTSLLLHIVSAILLFLLLERMTSALWQSAFVAAVFALHPLHVESVAWIAERKDVLSAFFWMLTILSYVSFVQRPALSRYFLVALSLVLGLMAKPMLVTLPFVLILLDYWPLGRIRVTTDTSSLKPQAVQLILEKVPLMVLAVISSGITIFVQKQIGAVLPLEDLPIGYRVGNALISYAEYAASMVWPSGLAVFYPHPGPALPVWKVSGAGLLLVSISFLMIRQIGKRPYLAVGWLWYLGTLVPVIGLVQVGSQAMADRYTYIPLIGLSIIMAWGIPDLLGTWRHRKIILAVMTVSSLCALIAVTRNQVSYWKNSITLFEHTLAVTSNNWVAHVNLANALREKKHDNRSAIAHYAEAAVINPRNAEVQYCLGVALYDEGLIEQSITHSLRASQLNPDYWQAHFYAGLALSRRGLFEDAIAHYNEVLRFKPDHEDAHYNMGVAFDKRGELDNAIVEYSEAIRLNPALAQAHGNLGAALQRQGKIEEAIAQYKEALRLKPDLVEARANLQNALSKRQETIKH